MGPIAGWSVFLDRAQFAEGLPSLRLPAGRLIEFSHEANRHLLDRANLPAGASVLCSLT